MAIKLHTNVRNAMLDAYESAIGPSPVLRIYDGAPPTDLLTPPPGNVLVEMTLPDDWAYNVSAGAMGKLGSWTGVCSADGTATHYRIFNGADAYEQGTIGTTGTDLTMADPAMTTGMVVSITTKSLLAGNAG